jgi:uncharacterized protein
MRYRTFPGIPDLPISVLGFGCMRLPVLDGDPGRIDEARATRLLRDAVDAGVNYVDTAYPYHGGQSEPFVGRALAGGYRARVQLATKCPTWLVQADGDWERFLDEQLRRLATDRVDFYLLHGLNGERWETVQRLAGRRALDRARGDRRVAHAGFSFHGSPDAFAAILAGYDWDFCQLQVNLLDVDYQAGLAGVRLAASRGVGVVAMVNTAAMFDARQTTAGLYRAYLVSRGVAADACVGCGECEPRCPQGIAIPDRLREAHELLG